MWMMQDFLPAYSWQEPQSYAPQNSPSHKNSLDNAIDWRGPSRLQFGGEIGFLYGSSSGKYGGQDFSGYIIGTVGNEWFSITAGYLHQESNVRYRVAPITALRCGRVSRLPPSHLVAWRNVSGLLSVGIFSSIIGLACCRCAPSRRGCWRRKMAE